MASETVRGPEPRRFCDCWRDTLQLVGQYYEYNELGVVTGEPTEFAHLPLCVLCQDDKAKGRPYGLAARAAA